MVENSDEFMKTKHAVKSPEKFKKLKMLKSGNIGAEQLGTFCSSKFLIILIQTAHS
jgi:hypothetical protein